jgi:hypothetical protein
MARADGRGGAPDGADERRGRRDPRRSQREERDPDERAEPVWLVRVVLILFLVGFAVFLAREVRNVIESLG